MLDVGGQDATEAFEDVGHSDEAREILNGMLVGNLKREVRFATTPSNHPTYNEQRKERISANTLSSNNRQATQPSPTQRPPPSPGETNPTTPLPPPAAASWPSI